MFQQIPFSQSPEVGEVPADLEGMDDGALEQPVEETTQVQGSEEGVYLTRKDLEAFKSEILEASRRQAQSYADQASSRADKRIREELGKVQTAVALMKANGIEVSDAQVETMRQKALASAYEGSDLLQSPASPSPSENGNAAQTADTITAEDRSFVQRSMARLNKKYGGQLLPTDPEADGMNSLGSAEEFVEAYEAGLQKKLARQSTPAAARVASAVGGAKTSPPTLQALTNELNKLIANPTPSALPRIRELNAQIAKLRDGK